MTGLARRGWLAALLGALLLAGCGGEPPPESFPPLTYGYLTKLRLNVASIDIRNDWLPGPGEHVEYLSPVQPLQALEQMARDRLAPSGNTGRATFIVQDASILAGPGRLDGSLAVRLEVSTSDGARSGYAEARVVRSMTGGPDQADGGRKAAYDLTKQMMDDMNVELEFQIRRTLRDYLLSTSAEAPLPGPVQAQPLAPPPGASAAPPGTPDIGTPDMGTPTISTPDMSTPAVMPPARLAPSPPDTGLAPSLSPPPQFLEQPGS
jgi:hypothetical protein